MVWLSLKYIYLKKATRSEPTLWGMIFEKKAYYLVLYVCLKIPILAYGLSKQFGSEMLTPM